MRAIGEEPADTLVAYLPPVGWADVATKQDLAMVETRHREELTLHDGLRTNLYWTITLMVVPLSAFVAAQVHLSSAAR